MSDNEEEHDPVRGEIRLREVELPTHTTMEMHVFNGSEWVDMETWLEEEDDNGDKSRNI